MARGGRTVDGTETGWGRPGEPAPRWRALLDRARLGGRTGEQGEVSSRRNGDEGPAGDQSSQRPAANGYSGAPGLGHPVEPGYVPEPSYPPAPTPNIDAGIPAESRYAALDNGYRPEPPLPVVPRYGAPGYAAPAGSGYAAPAGSGYAAPAGSGYAAPAGSRSVESRYAALESGYRPEPGYPAPPQYVAPVESGYAAPVESGYVAPVEPGYAAPAGSQSVESRYAALENGYRPDPGYPSRSPGSALEVRRPVPARWRANRSDAETERAVGVLRRDLGTPRVLAFANPKGGVHKTTATVLAAASIGSVRGRGVLAWDDNELRGTLGLRAGSARHARTIRHLIADLTMIESRHGTELTDQLDDYLRHASDGSYDVLAGEESPRFAQRLDQHTVRRVLELLRRTHDVICVDTGNNVESVNWQTVLQAADQLVLTTVPREDAAFTADWMLDLLHEVGMGELADNAVTLLSCPTPGRSPLMDDLERHFATRTRAVAVVPYDPALETGSSIEYTQLQDETRTAWLRAASMMVEPFAR
jgi:MinD-like ATPase involved in chromosome partitioning or flagellar assembly